MNTTFPSQLRKVQQAGEDFEWYPTTDEIIDAMLADMKAVTTDEDHDCYMGYRRYSGDGSHLFVDIGAGDGKVLERVRDFSKDNLNLGEFGAFEKSLELMRQLTKKDFQIMGTDWWLNSLMDKPATVVFSNPPYSEFEPWCAKILKEAACGTLIYLVVPDRWADGGELLEACALRQGIPHLVGCYDFKNAPEREARAHVDLLRIYLPCTRKTTDPFDTFFDETFGYPDKPESVNEDEEFESLVERTNLITALLKCYEARCMALKESIHALCRMPYDVLQEFEIPKESLKKSIKAKLENTRKEYWKRLFDGMSELTDKLTTKSREGMVNRLNDKTGIDFNRDNIYAVVFWAIDHANTYFDDQLIEVYEKMVCAANVENYVSNQRVFEWNRFRYHYEEGDHRPTHFCLKVGHRIVLESLGGLSCGVFGKGISEYTRDFLADLLTIGRNLGFNIIPCETLTYHGMQEWNTNSERIFEFRTEGGQVRPFMKVRSFKNRNLHIHFAPDFIHALNIQHGKLKGWLRNWQEAESEMAGTGDIITTQKFFTHVNTVDDKSLKLMG